MKAAAERMTRTGARRIDMAICVWCGKHAPWIEEGELCSECEWEINTPWDEDYEADDDAGEDYL